MLPGSCVTSARVYFYYVTTFFLSSPPPFRLFDCPISSVQLLIIFPLLFKDMNERFSTAKINQIARNLKQKWGCLSCSKYSNVLKFTQSPC